MPIQFIPKNTQRALDKINEISEILDKYKFYLAGGTALAFKLKYRVSYDLDFFTNIEFDPNELLGKFKEVQNIAVENIKIDLGTLKFNYLATDISFFHYPYNLLEPLETQKKIKLASALDIALMKITAIAGRGLEKDFADLYYTSIQLGGLKYILNKFKEKYPTTNLEHYLKSLVYFEDAENGPRPDILIPDYNWAVIKKYFDNEITSYLKWI